MKELTIEQKAEAYDRALEIARKEYKTHESFKGFCEMLLHIFPELKESEDERIKSAAIKFVRQNKSFNYCLGISKEDVIAWLEKQGQDPRKVSIWKHWKDGMAGKGAGKPIYLIKIGDTYNLSSYINFECDYIELSELDSLMFENQGNPNPYSGVSFKYNGHTWGMCARDNGVEILVDGEIKERVFAENTNTNAKEMFIKALERVEEQNAKGYKLTDCDKNSWWEDFKAYCCYSEHIHSNSAKTCKDEQKPAEWSEEDEMIALSIKQVMNCASLLNIVPEKIDKIRTWLKSLKGRVSKFDDGYKVGFSAAKYSQWKPSDGQISLLQAIINDPNNAASESCQIVLKEVIKQLKKLREE